MSGGSHARHFAPPSQAADEPRNLVGLSRAELEAEIRAFGEPAFRARQLWHWIYYRGATSFADMTSLSKAFRSRLAEHYVLARPAVEILDWDLLLLDPGEIAEIEDAPARGLVAREHVVGVHLA